MIKIILYILLAIILIALAAAGIHHYRVALKNARTMSAYEKEKITYNNNLGKVLVVYYSLSGHTKEIADKIKELTNADIYEIQTAEKINTTPWFYLTLRNQIKKGEYPQLKEPLPALEQYDVVSSAVPFGGILWQHRFPLTSNKLIFWAKKSFRSQRREAMPAAF